TGPRVDRQSMRRCNEAHIHAKQRIFPTKSFARSSRAKTSAACRLPTAWFPTTMARSRCRQILCGRRRRSHSARSPPPKPPGQHPPAPDGKAAPTHHRHPAPGLSVHRRQRQERAKLPGDGRGPHSRPISCACCSGSGSARSIRQV
ncbi:hypothetical protein IWW55_005175, partial [Coemansia sp. RSA 2706]